MSVFNSLTHQLTKSAGPVNLPYVRRNDPGRAEWVEKNKAFQLNSGRAAPNVSWAPPEKREQYAANIRKGYENDAAATAKTSNGWGNIGRGLLAPFHAMNDLGGFDAISRPLANAMVPEPADLPAIQRPQQGVPPQQPQGGIPAWNSPLSAGPTWGTMPSFSGGGVNTGVSGPMGSLSGMGGQSGYVPSSPTSSQGAYQAVGQAAQQPAQPAQPDYAALFRNTHGSSYDQNSRVDREKMEQMKQFGAANRGSDGWTPNTFSRNYYNR